MSRWVCRYCILEKGVSGLELSDWPDINDEEAQFEHFEMEHDIPVIREDEDREQAFARVEAANPRMGGPDCRCPACKRRRESVIR